MSYVTDKAGGASLAPTGIEALYDTATTLSSEQTSTEADATGVDTEGRSPSIQAAVTARAAQPGDWDDPQEPIPCAAPRKQTGHAKPDIHGDPSQGERSGDTPLDQPSTEVDATPVDSEKPTLLTPGEIAERCMDAKARDDAWEPVLYGAHPNAQAVDAVLSLLAGQSGFAGKRPLKNDYKHYAEEEDACASEAAGRLRICEIAGDRLLLRYDPTQLNDMVEQVEEALRTRPGGWEVLLHGAIPSYIATTPAPCLHQAGGSDAEMPDIPSLKPYTRESLLLRIEQSVCFYSTGKVGIKPIPVPKELVRLMLKKPDSNLPVTTGLVPHPLVLPDGTLLIDEGLHTGSGVYTHFGGVTFEAPGDMTPEDGVKILRTEMLGEFEFASAVDESAALALDLTSIMRKALDIAPGFLINANTQGSGKTTLARVVHLHITGREMLPIAMTENFDEQGKELTAVLAESPSIVCFDNVPDGSNVASSTLAKVLTSSKHTGRILGHTRMAKLSTNSVFVMTDNNLRVSLELSRRTLEIRLAPKDARPEQRRFAHPDVMDYTLRNRPRWMQAALAILSGSREPPRDAQPSGFEQWDRMVRYPLINAGVTDPVTKFDDMRESSPEHETRTAWILGLVRGYGLGTPFRSQDLVRQGGANSNAVTKASILEKQQRQEMYAEYLDGHPPAKGWGNVRSIGILLGGLVERNVEGYKLTRKTSRGTAHFTVVKA